MYKKGHGGMTAFEISKKIIDVLETSNWVENNVKERRKWIIEQVGEILELKPDGGMAHAYKTA
jgi:hypothetical protein